MRKLLFTVVTLLLVFSWGRVQGASLCAPTQPLAIADSFGFPVDPPGGYYDAQKFLQYNTSFKKYHLGEDWNGNGGNSTDYGDPVLSVANGIVTFVSNLGGSWGKVLIVRHDLPDGFQLNSLYAHLSRTLVKEGDHVQRGCQLGEIGDAEGYYKDKAHLHLELRVDQSMERDEGDGYAASLGETSTIANYTDPTRFIQSRLLSSVSALSPGWNSLTNTFTSAASLNFGWVENHGTRFSLAEAVNANLIYYLAYQWVNGAWRTFDIRTGTFNPRETYWIYSFSNDVAFAFYGQYDLDQQALQDMVARSTKDTRFASYIGNSFGKNLDWDANFALRWINFNFSWWRVVTMYQATSKDDPSVRFTIFWDPTAGRWIGWDQVW
jgi:hypothetical protein